MNSTVVIGLGNTLVGDEGIGVILAEKLPETYFCPDIDCIDLGTSVFKLLYLLESRTKAIILDCALMGTEAGTIRSFNFNQAKSVRGFRHFSLHELDLFGMLAGAAKMGIALPEIGFYGIQPAALEIGASLSPLLLERIPKYLEVIAEGLGLHKIT
jgi:hydrogenase maturation protease